VPPRTAAARARSRRRSRHGPRKWERTSRWAHGRLVAAAVGRGLWALVTIITGFQIGWMAVGVASSSAGGARGRQRHAHGVRHLGAALALAAAPSATCSRSSSWPRATSRCRLQAVFTRLTPDVVWSLTETTFKPIHVLFYGFALYEGYRFSIVGGTSH